MKIGMALALLLLLTSPVWAAGPVNPTVASWTAPTTNTDGSALTDLAAYNVYMASGATVPVFPGAGWTKTTVAAASPAPAPNTTVTTSLGAQPNGQRYIVVTAVDLAGNESAGTAAVAFLVDRLAPTVPSNLLVQ